MWVKRLRREISSFKSHPLYSSCMWPWRLCLPWNWASFFQNCSCTTKIPNFQQDRNSSNAKARSSSNAHPYAHHLGGWKPEISRGSLPRKLALAYIRSYWQKQIELGAIHVFLSHSCIGHGSEFLPDFISFYSCGLKKQSQDMNQNHLQHFSEIIVSWDLLSSQISQTILQKIYSLKNTCLQGITRFLIAMFH